MIYSITENLTGVTSDNSDVSIEEGTEKVINYVAAGSNMIDSIESNLGTVVIADDGKTGSVTFIATENIIIDVVSSVGYLVKLTGSFINCSCNYINNERYSKTKVITISADVGCVFKDVYTYRHGNVIKKLNANDENTVLTVDGSITKNINLNDSYNATKEIVQLGTFTNLYKVTNKELIYLSKARFVGDADLGQNITNLYELPFTLPVDLVGDRSNIMLGSVDTGVQSTLINNYKYVIDLGSINVVEKYHNVYDYINTNYILHLPFFDKIYIDSEYIVNETLSIQFVIDLYSGNATVNIYSSFIDSIIESRTNIIVSQIPFMQKQTNSVIGNITTVNKNNIVTPFIEVVRNIPYNVNTIFGGETIEYGVIGDYEGFTRCENVLLNSRATNTEKEEIIKLLNEGVIL